MTEPDANPFSTETQALRALADDLERQALELRQSAARIDNAARDGNGDRLNYTVKHAAELVDMSQDTLRAEIHAGRLGTIKVGTWTYITREALVRWLRSKEGEHSPPIVEEVFGKSGRRAS